MIVDCHARQVHVGAQSIPCIIGYGGAVEASAKREGDGCTPLGAYPLRCMYWRADRLELPFPLSFPAHPITPQMGWCDDPVCEQYNREVTLPHVGSHELMWREDSRYDLCIVLGYNDAPPLPGHGSAIFFHLIEPGAEHTQGCVAVSREAMLSLLPQLSTHTIMEITR